MYKVLSVGRDPKTIKGEKLGYLTGIIYLTPCKVLCPCCSKGCMKVCLFSSGHGQIRSVVAARNNRTFRYLHKFKEFRADLIEDIQKLCNEAAKKNLKPCVRINGTSDIDVEKVFGDVLDMYPSVQFYDYTKDWKRVATKPNYYLCYSRSEKTPDDSIKEYLTKGRNVAIVFQGPIPETYLGFPTTVGDESDLRFLDEPGHIVALTAKGSAKKDASGFVVWTEPRPVEEHSQYKFANFKIGKALKKN